MSKTEDYRYSISYNFEFPEGGVTKEELLESGHGGCDCAVLISILGEPCTNETMSVMVLSTKKDKEPLLPIQEFQIWSTWAGMLADQLRGTPAGEVCLGVISTVRELLELASMSGDVEEN